MIPYNSNIWLQDSINHKLIITDGTLEISGNDYAIVGSTVIITNENIDFEKFELNQALCSQAQIRYGSCESGYIEFTMYENIGTVKGKWLKVYMIPNFDVNLTLQLGKFKVAEDNLTADRTRRQVRAQDAMFDILNTDVTTWYNNILPNSSSSVTLLQFRTSFLNYFNLTAESVSLINDNITIRRTLNPETLSGADVIRAICEINGVFGTITNEGKFRFVELNTDIDAGLFPGDDLYPADDLYPQNPSVTEILKQYYINVEFEDYDSEGITQLTIRTNNEDVGATVGVSGNRYIITGNFLVFGYSSTNLTNVANNVLTKIGGRPYKPCTVQAIGNPLFEVGDPIRFNTAYRGIVTYILERKLTGIQGLRDTYTAQGAQYYNEQLNSVSSQFKQLSGKTASLIVDIEGIEGRVEDIEDGSASVIRQLSDEIDARVTQGELSSAITAVSGQIQLCVTKEGVVGDLNAKMSGITITPSSIQVSSDGTFTVNSTNFKLDSSGNCTLGSVSFTGGEIEMTRGSGLSLYHGGIAVDSNGYLNISGNNAGAGSSTFYSVAINGHDVHINHDGGGTTQIYNCDNIYNRTDTSYSFIRMRDSAGALRIQGDADSRILIDSSDYAEDIILIGSVDIGNSASRSVKIKNRYCKWKSLTINGTSYNFLVEDT